MTLRNGSKPGAKRAPRSLTVSSGLARLLPRTRWAEWVRALAERWGRGFERNDRPAMILLQLLTVTRHLRERWLVKSERFYPTINLSVQAILRATGPNVLLHGHSRDFVPLDRRAQSAVSSEPRDSGMPAGIALRVGASGYRGEDREPNGPGRIESRAPLERIFTRNESLLRLREADSTARAAFIGRLTQQSQRTDLNISTSAMSTTRLVTAHSVTQEKALSAASEMAETPPPIPGFDASQPRMNREPGSEPSPLSRREPQISIERITDQVIRQLDRRVMAARERVGRTF